MSIGPVHGSGRWALAYALDRKEFLALIGPGIAEPVFSPVPVKFLPGGLTEKEVQARKIEYPYDPAQAKKLLAESGFPQGFSLEVVTSELPGYRVLYESMQGQLAKVGVKVAVKVVDHATMHSMIRKDANPLRHQPSAGATSPCRGGCPLRQPLRGCHLPVPGRIK